MNSQHFSDSRMDWIIRKNNIDTIEYCIPYTIDGVKAFFLSLHIASKITAFIISFKFTCCYIFWRAGRRGCCQSQFHLCPQKLSDFNQPVQISLIFFFPFTLKLTAFFQCLIIFGILLFIGLNHPAKICSRNLFKFQWRLLYSFIIKGTFPCLLYTSPSPRDRS